MTATCKKCRKGFMTTVSGQVKTEYRGHWQLMYYDFCSNVYCDEYNRSYSG